MAITIRRREFITLLGGAAATWPLGAGAQPTTMPCCAAADRILLTRLGPSQSSLFVSNADGSGERVLTEGALDYNPTWSPDGTWIVFTSEREGSADLFRMKADGSGLERLTDDPAYDDQAAFSPDGSLIVFVTTRAGGRANLWILDLKTRRAMPLTSGPGGDFRPAWSPDGQWIAFSSDRESSLPMAKGRWERLQLVDIYLVRPDGSELKRISRHGDFCGSPKWSRDSRSVVAYCMPAEDTWTYRVALRKGGQPEEGETTIMRIDIANGEAVPVNAGPGVKSFPSILPSGEVAYVRTEVRAQGVFYSSGKAGPTGDVRWPAWSPDGNRIVYGREVLLPPGSQRKLWSRNPQYELLSTGLLPAYDPSGERYVATAVAANRRDTTLMLTEGAGPAKKLLESKDELILAPQWSPNGDAIIFGIGKFAAFLDFAIGAKRPVDPVNGGAQVAMIKADGSGFHKITSGANNNGFASYSPEGKRIVYRTMGPDGEGLRIMNLDDRAVTTLTGEYDNFPVWSPRGDLIAFVRRVEDDFAVFTIRPSGTDLRRLTHSKGNEAHLAWSPDGEKILFSSTRMGFKDEALYTWAPQPYGELFVMRYDGTQVEQLTDNQWEDAGPAWRPRKN
jgi:Tol biopolymer transport system component